MTPKVKALWDELAQRHRLDPNRNAASLFQTFNRIADDVARTLVDLAMRHSTLRAQWQAEDEALRLTRAKPVCAEWGAKNLEHFYTSKRDGGTLCALCYQQRMAQGTVQKAASAGS